MKKILVETSARHVHVTQQDLEALFGAGHELTVKSWLSQPGQFASEEQVDVVGPKNTLKRVRILGPVRSATQVELSLTDARSIGVTAPVRERGDVVVRVSEKFSLAMHIDTDESNAACAVNGTMGELIK